ncbi:hypothetical protein HanPI659440_Chr09g0358891 [Helianthus annuus]|nr:hypothetical protein HanPI659440_Chr09g0358891 [Helianthus annuus]
MEQYAPEVAKKVWSMVRAMLYMIKKNISKRKLLLDLNMMMKRSKIARKALKNRMHHHHSPNFPEHYEFSCSNTPVYPLSFFTTNKKHHKQHKKTTHNKSTVVNNEHDHIFVDPAVIKALEMMLASAAASPVVPGLGKSPMVRQLRVTDSPFPLSNGEEDSYVDEAAEKFIVKFYNELRRQS